VKVRARAWEGYVDPAVLSDRSLLEIYIIDVGQGDGVLLKTPDGQWHLIDGGVASRDHQLPIAESVMADTLAN
jgi:beta-lactamase superfamily II metal-dependent hydrolase